ncbi:MAG TPA: hypothetical protein VE860_26805 [Chthoniobacterales bacterium]|jgi:hypothetical protein|nr:hypothetical protein [Chthoniobacterales bacterium]
MKRLSFVLLLAGVLAPGFVLAQDTAYKALRAVGTKRGEKALNQVTSLVGKLGKPQPVDWRVTLDDPTARGGVRELDIVSGQISSERTPAQPAAPGLPPIDLTKLNLDSDGAFQTAEREAKRNQVGFDSVNYRLAVDGPSHEPVWTLELYDYEQRPVGTVRIAAGSGTLLGASNWVPEGRVARNQRPPSGSDAQLLNEPPPPPEDVRPPAADTSPDYRDRNYASSDYQSDDQGGGSLSERANRFGASVVQFGQNVAHRTTRIFQTVGGWFQEKFTGRNTIDPKHGQDEDESSAEPDYSRDQYSKPVTPEPPEGQ